MSVENRKRMYDTLIALGREVPECLVAEFGGAKVEPKKVPDKVEAKDKKVPKKIPKVAA